MPASGIATIEPPPSASRMNPSAPSSSPSRSLANGTIGAQLEVAVPQIRNIALVPRLPPSSACRCALRRDRLLLGFRRGLLPHYSAASTPDLGGHAVAVPGTQPTAASPTFAVSMHSIPGHSSSPKSAIVRAFCTHGFQTTVEPTPASRW